ncbi:MAG: hypothetical protein PGN13_14890 [Patulibacter minatonensis]
MPRLRPFAALTALLVAGSLAACTTESQVCKNGVCKLSMSGKGATAELGGKGGSTIELVSADGTEARVKIAGREGTLKLNQPIGIDNGTITLTEVKKDKLKLRIEGGSSSSGGSKTTPDSSGDAPTS